MKILKYAPITQAIADFYEDNGIKQQDVDESLIEKWATDWVAEISTDVQLVHRIAWLDVKNYKAELPADLDKCLEVAYRLEKPKSNCGQKGHQIVQYIQNTHEGCQLELNVVCPSCHKSGCSCTTEDIIVDINTAWEVSHPEIYYDKYLRVGRFGYGNSIYDESWKILKTTTNDWFGLNKVVPNCANIVCKECEHSFRVVAPSTIETSFEKGELLVSYMGKMVDSEGSLMIPDHRWVHEAILQHLTYKHFRREHLNKGGDVNIYREAMALRDLATTKAISALGTPEYKEFSEFWGKTKHRKIENGYERYLKGYGRRVKLPNRDIHKS